MRPRTLLGWLALSLISCAQAVGPEPDDTARGALVLALTAKDSGGVEYRLRNATFTVSGYPEGMPFYPNDGYAGYGGYGGRGGYPPGYLSIEISSEADPDAALITRRLPPGGYEVVLQNSDWYLERTTDDGVERVEQAVLLTQPYQYVYVWDGGTSQINYRFGVDGEYIDFRSGELQIGIEIEKPGEHCPGYGYGGYGGYGGAWGYAGAAAPGCAAGAGGSAGIGVGGSGGSAGAAVGGSGGSAGAEVAGAGGEAAGAGGSGG